MSIGRVPGVTGIQPSIVDAKGDLIVATAADSVSRLAVGANGTVLTADSAEATGLKWVAPSGASYSGCQLYRTTDQAIPDSANTTINWTAEDIDVGGYHDNSTNNSRITIPTGKGGYYFVYATVGFAANASGRRLWRFLKNGSSYRSADNPFTVIMNNQGSSSECVTSMGLVINLAAGDYVEVQCWQNSGGNLNVMYSANFGAYLIGA